MGNCFGIAVNKKISKDNLLSKDNNYYQRKPELPIGNVERHYQKSSSIDGLEDVNLLDNIKTKKSFSF